MEFFPLFHRVSDKRCLIVGGGNVALRRARLLAKAGAVIEVVAPVADSEICAIASETGGVYYKAEFTERAITNDYFCVVAATDNTLVNLQACKAAKDLGVPVNVVDSPADCDFIFSAVIDREPLRIAISNSGASPVLSRLLKQQINQFVPDAYGDLSAFVGANRQRVKAAITEEKQRTAFWEQVLQGAIAEAVFSGKQDEAQLLLQDALSKPRDFAQNGEVYLIGAGPGDPDLLTLRAFRLLQQTDVVLYDRLVSDEVMALVPASTELVYVGKRRDDHSVPQGGINQLLVDYARQGKRVARLKGGDPFIFGRGGEEIETLADEQIPFQVVPGITAASGCSAYSGIPLTHRDYAQSVQFVTGQLQNGSINLNWPELISTDKTLVFYMGLKSLPIICEQLIAHGMAENMPVALIEKGTTQQQRVMTATLATLSARIATEQVVSPSLFIVGNVVNLAAKLTWFEADNSAPFTSGEGV